MVKIRTAKSKGSQLEYDVEHNLKELYPDIYRTSERGFQMQYDLHSEGSEVAIECKRHAKLTYTQAEKYFKKLQEKAIKSRKHYLIFKNNRMPVLVMHLDHLNRLVIHKFEELFRVNWEKHPSTRAKK